MLARIEAINAGADEAVLLNADGRVTEGTTENIFIVRHGALLTPLAIDGGLEGITRNTILGLAAKMGISAREVSPGIL